MPTIRLFSERGFDAVTVEDIAGEADVSRRTFFRYYASKEDVLFSDYPRWLAQLRQAVAAGPAEEPAFTALRRAFLSLSDDYRRCPAREVSSGGASTRASSGCTRRPPSAPSANDIGGRSSAWLRTRS